MHSDQPRDPFSYYRDFINSIESRVQQLARDYGVEHLSGPQGFTVMYLSEHADEEIFIKDIEKKLKISKSVASNLVKRMEKNGFIQLVPSQKDKRYKSVRLTELGEERAQAVKVFHEAIHQQFLEGINPEELKIAQKVFTQIRHNLTLNKE